MSLPYYFKKKKKTSQNESNEPDMFSKAKPKKQAKKAEKKKPSKGPNKIYFQRKSEKSLDNFITQKIKDGYLLLAKREKDGYWTASMERAK